MSIGTGMNWKRWKQLKVGHVISLHQVRKFQESMNPITNDEKNWITNPVIKMQTIYIGYYARLFIYILNVTQFAQVL